MSRSISSVPILVVLLVGVLACGESAGPNSTNGVVGSYVATTFTLDQGGPLIDLLSAGSSLTLTLTSAGSTTGTLFVPASVAGGADFLADMSGTYQVVGEYGHLSAECGHICPRCNVVDRWDHTDHHIHVGRDDLSCLDKTMT